MALTVSGPRAGGVLALGLLGLALAAVPLHAQEARAQPDARPWFVSVSKWAKWPTLAAAAGFTTLAILAKSDADGVYAQLQDRCSEDPASCELGIGGGYLDPEAETLYQETLRLDGRARRWMVGGQGFLFVSGGLFLIDLVAGSSKPKNIPFAPLEAYAAPGTLGLRWRF